MNVSKVLSEFSKNRLGGEPVPNDVKLLLAHSDELAEQTGIELNWAKDWAPWLDTSYLSAAERANPDIAANVRAIAQVCGHVAFIAADEDGQHFGYWRGLENRPVARSPLVLLDNEGQFNLCAGSNFAEAVLAGAYDEERFTELREWLQSLGIAVRADSLDDLKYPDEPSPPDQLHSELYRRYLDG